MNRNGILATGNWIIDFVKIIDEYPTQDALANIESESASNGGSPYNILKNFVKMGAPFPLEALGLVGEDDNGRHIIKECKGLGIETSLLQTTPESSTSYTDVMTVKSTGRRTFFHQRGANAQLSLQHMLLEKSSAKIFHLGYLLLLDKMDLLDEEGVTYAGRAFEKAKALGFETSADVVSESSDRFKTIVPATLPYVDYLFINEFEAERSTGIEIAKEGNVDTAKAIEACKALIEMGVHKTVFLHYPKGAVAYSANGEVTMQGSAIVPQEVIKGATGAGDAFATGILYGIHEGFAMQDILKLGVCTAASCLFDPSCSEGVALVKDALALGEKYGFHAIS